MIPTAFSLQPSDLEIAEMSALEIAYKHARAGNTPEHYALSKQIEFLLGRVYRKIQQRDGKYKVMSKISFENSFKEKYKFIEN